MIRVEENAEIFQDKHKNYIWELLRERIGRDRWPDWGVSSCLTVYMDVLCFIFYVRMFEHYDGFIQIAHRITMYILI